jgi:hypothetical protein
MDSGFPIVKQYYEVMLKQNLFFTGQNVSRYLLRITEENYEEPLSG